MKKRKYVTYFISVYMNKDLKEEYFFSTDHYQPDISDNWVPITIGGKDKQQVIEKYLNDAVEVKNPNPQYQA